MVFFVLVFTWELKVLAMLFMKGVRRKKFPPFERGRGDGLDWTVLVSCQSSSLTLVPPFPIIFIQSNEILVENCHFR